ncbi:unnamed protein product (macronuclear) [Paramecium tetraurelia]|uniref:TRP C-terminal domain-containing protein n=1 Tax=Paramecium tetraurelia TaxID=5888 RepID=A0CMU2_PARTE|nr:uncharacterized protein GSPATT00038726001 [Paramecium tetraurelia]CAK72109.1 unnamed protein product [Paramecium tetraurelia]|eukprot:XP_001439506.1 hypothetical protein (macronuclear) [Paramecium tetraurelia strain d4-2]
MWIHFVNFVIRNQIVSYVNQILNCQTINVSPYAVIKQLQMDQRNVTMEMTLDMMVVLNANFNVIKAVKFVNMANVKINVKLKKNIQMVNVFLLFQLNVNQKNLNAIMIAQFIMGLIVSNVNQIIFWKIISVSHVEMELQPKTKNVMMETGSILMDAQINVKLKKIGIASTPYHFQVNVFLCLKFRLYFQIQLLTYNMLNYHILIKLNQINRNINFLDFNLNSINIEPTYYNISIFPVIEIVSNETRDINYELKIQINQQLSQNPILKVEFNLILLDENDLLVPPSSQQIVLKAPLVLNQAQVEVSQNFQKFGYNIMLALGCFAIFALLLGFTLEFLEILDTLQFYSYLKFINVEYPENLYIYFQSSELISIEPILQFVGIKDNFEDYLGINIIQCFGKFYQYQINADLITNIYSQLIQVILYFLSLVLLKIYLNFCLKFCFTTYITYIRRQGIPKVVEWITIKLYQLNKYIKKCINFDNINLIINCYYANTWDLSFKVLLYLTFNQQSGIRTLFSQIVCFIYFILGIVIILRNFRSQNTKIDIKELRDQQHQLTIVLKKFTFVLILIAMQDCSIAQSIMLSFFTCMYIGFIMIIKFTNTKLELMNILSVEIPVLLFTLINLSFCKDFNNHFTPDQIIRIGFLQIGCLILGFLGPLINCVYQFSKKLKLIYLKIRPKQVKIKFPVPNILQEVKS